MNAARHRGVRQAVVVLALAALTAPAAGGEPAEPAEPVDPQTEAIAAGLDAAQADLHRCWEKGAADDYLLAGTITLRLTFAKAGKVKKVKVVSDTAGDAELATCVTGLAAKWVWGDALAASELEVPLAFESPGAQYTIRSADVTSFKPKGGKLEAKILLDRDNVGADKASLVLLSLMGATRMPMHQHTSAEIIYVLEGNVQLEGLGGTTDKSGPELAAGDAAYLGAGVAHAVLATCCKRKFSHYLVLYAPGGVERPYKDPRAKGTATTPVKPPKQPDLEAAQPRLVKAADVQELAIAGGKGTAKILFDKDSAGDGAAYVGQLTLQAETQVPEHVHAAEAEILYVLAGAGDMTIKGTVFPVVAGMAVYIPPNTKHSFLVTSKEPVQAVQFYTPSGPEQRFKTPPAKADAKPEKKPEKQPGKQIEKKK